MIKTIIILLSFFNAVFVFAQSTKSKQTESTKPFVLGVIEEIQSKELKEKRILNVYLPEGYDPKDTVKYPVIYLLDGSADEDFIHIVGLVQFNSFEWVDQVPKSIVVGIANVDRRRDFTFPSTVEYDKRNNPSSGHSDKFIAFIEKELQPFIQAKYKTNGTKTIIGQSLGGLLATEILLTKTSLFTHYIIVSPSLWWDSGSLLNKLPTSLENVKVFIGVGKEGLTPSKPARVMEEDVRLLYDMLVKIKSNKVMLDFDYFPQENHATILHQAVFNAFKSLWQKEEKD
ncbi:MAG TPA: alpha/beta hydrolase-fold protein [Bacteroidia bacterium]